MVVKKRKKVWGCFGIKSCQSVLPSTKHSGSDEKFHNLADAVQ